MPLRDEPKIRNYLRAYVSDALTYYARYLHQADVPGALNFAHWSFENNQSDEATSFSSGSFQRSSSEPFYSLLSTFGSGSCPETALKVELNFGGPDPNAVGQITIHVTNELLSLIEMDSLDSGFQRFLCAQRPDSGFQENEQYDLFDLSCDSENPNASIYFVPRFVAEGIPFHFVILKRREYQDFSARYQETARAATEALPEEPVVQHQEDTIVTLPSGRTCPRSELAALAAELRRDLAFLEDEAAQPSAPGAPPQRPFGLR